MKYFKRSWLAGLLVPCLALAGCFGKKKEVASQRGTGTSSEPDKVLFERATADLQKSRYTEARLALQTLINTYPDSEYLAKAKLAVADSYYKEGGTSGFTQAVAEYQDFITFFPFLDEASYAQMQIGMTHYRQMEKADRDRNEAMEAEGAFQTYLQKYPNSPLSAQVEQRLRDVQEVIAEGDFRVASFYYLRHVDRAAAARLIELANRYPLYSQADRSNWMLATLYERSEHKDIAAQYYARIVKDYPLSPLAAGAKDKLVAFGAPVPPADQTALARMQKEQQTPHPHTSILGHPRKALKTGPDVSMAARVGTPTLTPEDDENTDTLSPGGNLAIGSGAGSGPAGATGSGAYVETVTPGSASASASAGASTPSAAGVPPAATPPSSAGAASSNTVSQATSGESGAGADSTATGGSSTETAVSGAPADSSQTGTAATSSASDPKNESTSKKKKRLHKLNPF